MDFWFNITCRLDGNYQRVRWKFFLGLQRLWDSMCIISVSFIIPKSVYRLFAKFCAFYPVTLLDNSHLPVLTSFKMRCFWEMRFRLCVVESRVQNRTFWSTYAKKNVWTSEWKDLHRRTDIWRLKYVKSKFRYGITDNHCPHSLCIHNFKTYISLTWHCKVRVSFCNIYI